MARTVARKEPLVLSDEERVSLERLTKRRKSAQAIALRARIVLACAQPGVTNLTAAAELGVNPATVGKWRARFIERRLNGLLDEDRPGAPRKITDDKMEKLIVKTLEEKLEGRGSLVDAFDGPGDGDESDVNQLDLAGVQLATAPGRQLQVVDRRP